MAKKPTRDEALEALMKIAHMQCDGDLWFLSRKAKESGADGADVSNDHLQDQMVEAVCLARTTLGIQETGPLRKPTQVPRST